MSGQVSDPSRALRTLSESRRREKAQTLFYRALAADAELAMDADASERLNELHADEQHHLSRLTARILELGGVPEELRDVPTPDAPFETWQVTAREREADEVGWYEEALGGDMDAESRRTLSEILESERRHHAELRGKSMSA